MRGASYGLIVLGVIFAMAGVVNHFLVKMNPVAHTSTILIGVGGVLFIVGLLMNFMGDRGSSAK